MQEHGILLESGTNEMELLIVYVGRQQFGINVAKVQSVQQFDPALVTRMPEAPPGIFGMFLYRNTTIPLMDLSQILDIRQEEKSEREIVVVTEFNHAVNSFRVQGVHRICRLSWKEFVPMDQIFEKNSYFVGSVNVDNEQILVLDLEHILSDIFPGLVIEEVNDETIEKRDSVTRDKIEIIFAEDSPTMRKGVVRALKKAGFGNIHDFENGEVALYYIMETCKGRSRQDNLNTVLITDIEMPKMDGLALCRQMKQTPDLKDIYVVMFSSLINKQMIAKCEKVKADNYVTKPETNKLIGILDQRCSPE